MHLTTPKIDMTNSTENVSTALPKANSKTKENGTKRVLTGIVLALAVMFTRQEASASASLLHVLYKTVMVNTGVDANAKGQIDGTLNRQGNANNQRLKITLSNLDPGTDYQLSAFIGDDSNRRVIAGFTTDSKGAFSSYLCTKMSGQEQRGRATSPQYARPDQSYPSTGYRQGRECLAFGRHRK